MATVVPPRVKSTKDAAEEQADKKDEGGIATEANEPGKKKELEQDAPEDGRSRVEPEQVGFNMAEATMNALPTSNGKILMTLNEGGLQYLLASVRATAGVKAGRYMFEAKIVETLNPAETPGGQGRAPAPRHLVRLGFSLAGSSVVLADTEDSICFDSEGFFVHGKKRTKAAQKFSRDHIVAVLLNLDAASPNANTISLFKDGVRVSDPQPIPQALRDKALTPTITYKNVTLQVNFGPHAFVPLPFSCRTLRDAAAADLELSTPTADGKKCEVVFPIGLPDHGLFDWADQFLAEHPDFTELSDRKTIEWATKSGFWRPKGQGKSDKGSNDKPFCSFGVPMMDDLSARNVISRIAPMLRRNFMVMDMGANLVPSERQLALRRFRAPHFKKVAVVAMGEPDEKYRAYVRDLFLKEKTVKVEAEKRKRAAEKERVRLLEEKKRKAEQAKREREAKQRKKLKQEAQARGEEVPDSEPEAEEQNKEAKPDADVDEEESKPVELTEEELKVVHRRSDLPDMSTIAIAKSYAKFALPDKAEGFDEIRYIWEPQDKCATLLGEMVSELKKTQRVEDLQPCEWFTRRLQEWRSTLTEWRKKQSEWKEAEKKRLAQQKKDKMKKGTEDDTEEPPSGVGFDDLDVFSVEDVLDVGGGEPLFGRFTYEDWTLLAARVELLLLTHGFRKAVDDPERPNFPEGHFNFYYGKHFKKQFSLKIFGVENLAGVIDLINDTITISEDGRLNPEKPEDITWGDLLKLTEESRRERERRVDAGDETARLRFTRPQPTPPKAMPGTPAPPGLVQGASAPARRPPPPPPAVRPGTAGASAQGTQRKPTNPTPPPPTKRQRPASYTAGSAPGPTSARG